MCGIVGLVGPQRGDWIMRMNGAQIHRGPDDAGIYQDQQNAVALAFRRLSIVDLADGHQPMRDVARSRVVVFNGEIFNAPQLRTELEAQGYGFRTTNSDTEVLLYLYDRDGEAMLERLNGMFAFVIYDQRRGRLFGARDRLGIKPLHYVAASGNFAFASEIKSLLSLPFVARECNRQSAHHYLTLQFVPGPDTIFRGIKKLQAGHFFDYDIKATRFVTRRYWKPPSADSEQYPGPLTERQAATQLRELLRESVRDWLMSDVAVGCSLSGGVDSSAVVGLMAEQGIKPIRTWSLGFEDAQDLDERALAAAVARRWGTEHHEIVLRSESIVDDLAQMVVQLEEPYAGGLPSWYVFKAMSESVKVAMTGTGGDELFGNYGKWQAHELSRVGMRRLIGRVRANGLGGMLRHPHGALYHGYFFERQKERIWREPPPVVSTPALIEQYWRESASRDPRQAIPFVDMQLQLPEEFLLMTDRFSMAWSIEARTPLLDHRLVEFTLRLPAALRTRPRELKRLFRVAVADLLPKELLSTRKRGFVLPVAEWLRGKLRPLVDDLLSPAYLQDQGLFRSDLHRRFVKPHFDRVADHAWQIWTLLMFQMWWHQFMKRGASAASQVEERADAPGRGLSAPVG